MQRQIIDTNVDAKDKKGLKGKKPELIDSTNPKIETTRHETAVNALKICEGKTSHALLRAASRLSGKNIDDIEMEDLEKLWTLIKNPPWVKNFIPALKTKLEEKAAAHPDIEIDELVSDLELHIEAEPGYLVMIDLNAYSDFQNQATDRQKAILDTDYQKKMFALCEKYGATLVQAPAGDAFLFKLNADQRNLQRFTEELNKTRIKVPLAKPDPNKYPDGIFKFKTVVRKNTNDLKLSLFTGGIEGGMIDVYGESFAKTLKMETEDNLTHESSTNHERINDQLPKDKKKALALMTAIVRATHPRGSISTISNNSSENLPNKLGVTSITLYAGSIDKISSNPEAYSNLNKKILALLKQYPHFSIFKKDEAKYHIHCELNLNEETGKQIIKFCAGLQALAKSEHLEAGIGVGYTETMVRTRVVGSSLEERAGAGIVKSTRLATIPERALRLDGEFCKKAFGNIFELESVKVDDVRAKGGDIQCVTIPINAIDHEKLEGKNLIGFEEKMQTIRDFIDGLGKNGGSLQIISKESGTGVSALIRYSMRYAKEKDIKTLNIERIGDDNMGLMRGIVCALDESLPKDLRPNDVVAKFNGLLLKEDIWNEPKILVLDQKEISDAEKDSLDKLLSSIISTKTCLIHSGDYENPLSQKIEIEALSPGKAAEMILQMKKSLNPDIYFDPIVIELEKIRANSENPPLTPRNILKIYAAAMEVHGDIIKFNHEKFKNVKVGELVQKINSDNLNEERQTILGVLAFVGESISADLLYEILPNKNHKDIFLNDLNFLTERNYLDYDEETGEYSLKNKNLRTEAIAVAASQIDKSDLSKKLVEENLILNDERRFEHILTSNEKNLATELKALTKKIAKRHSLNRNLSAERSIYLDYINFCKNNSVDIYEDKELCLAIAWAFHNGNEDQKSLAKELLADLEKNADDRFFLKIKWIEYRLSLKNIEENIPTELMAKLSNDEIRFNNDDADEYFKIGINQVMIRKIIAEIQKKTCDNAGNEKSLIIKALEIEDLYQRIMTFKVLRNRRRRDIPDYIAGKKAELLDETEHVITQSNLSMESDMAILGTILRLIGGASHELDNHEMAINVLETASTVFEQIETPDYKQMAGALIGQIGARMFVIENLINNCENANAEWRRMVDEKIAEVEANIIKLDELCLIYGDIYYRAENFQCYSDLAELKMRIATKFPLPKDKCTDFRKLAEGAKTKVQKRVSFKKIMGNYAATTLNQYETYANQLINDAYTALPDHLKQDMQPTC